MESSAIFLKTNIYYPASYYYCSGFIPELMEEMQKIVQEVKDNKTNIKTINMNDDTYYWLSKLFKATDKYVQTDAKGKYLFAEKYPIILVPRTELEDGMIRFNTEKENDLD